MFPAPVVEGRFSDVYWKFLVEFQAATIAVFALLMYVAIRRQKLALGRPRTARLSFPVVVAYVLAVISLGFTVASLVVRH